MRHFCSVLVVTFCCVICSGCGTAKIQQLTAEVERLKANAAKLEADKASLESELAKAKQELNQVAEIRRGYEDARTKLAVQLKQLAPVLGNADSPLPPFESLRDSSWIGKFTPGAGLAPGIKELQNELKSLLGEEAKKRMP